MPNDLFDNFGRATEQDELNRLRVENEQLRRERDHLRMRLWLQQDSPIAILGNGRVMHVSRPACNTD